MYLFFFLPTLFSSHLSYQPFSLILLPVLSIIVRTAIIIGAVVGGFCFLLMLAFAYAGWRWSKTGNKPAHPISVFI